MPIEHEYNQEDRLMVDRYSGRVTREAILLHLQTVLRELSEADGPVDIIGVMEANNNMTAAISIIFDELVKALSYHPNRGDTVGVVSSNGAIFTLMAKAVEGLNFTIQLARSEEEARAYIDNKRSDKPSINK